MSTISNVEHYLAAMAKMERNSQVNRGDTAGLPFITLSRQAGAGGRSLAEVLLKAMAREADAELFHGWQIFDRQLCESVVQDPELQDSLRSLLDEYYHSQIGEFVLGLFGRQTPQDAAILRLSQVMRSLASVGKVIIVGRGGSQVAKGLPQGLHLRLIAPERVRVQRMMTLLGMTISGQDEAAARRRTRELDKERDRLLKTHFQVDVTDPLNYHAVWNTDEVALETIAAAVIAMIKQRAKP